MLKKIISFLSTLFYLTSAWASLQTDLSNAIGDVIPNVTTNTTNINYVVIAQELKFWIFAFIGIIAVAYIIYTGAKLLWAPGNTEEVTTSLKSLGYIVLGLAIIPFAYFIIQFIVNLRI